MLKVEQKSKIWRYIMIPMKHKITKETKELLWPYCGKTFQWDFNTCTTKSTNQNTVEIPPIRTLDNGYSVLIGYYFECKYKTRFRKFNDKKYRRCHQYSFILSFLTYIHTKNWLDTLCWLSCFREPVNTSYSAFKSSKYYLQYPFKCWNIKVSNVSVIHDDSNKIFEDMTK